MFGGTIFTPFPNDSSSKLSKKMKIAFDAKRITHNATGLGNYSRFVVNGLAAAYPALSLQLYSPSKGKEALKNRVKPSPSLSFHYPMARVHRAIPALWRSYGVSETLRKEGVDLYHGLSNEIPLNLRKYGIPSVVTIHDLIFLRYPRLYRPIDRQIYPYKFRKASELSDRIIAVSQQTSRDIQHFFHISENKISVIYQGCDPAFGETVPEKTRQTLCTQYGIESPYILYVGSIEERKNLLLVLRALRGLREDIRLIAIGRRTPYADRVETYARENHLTDRVQLLSDIPFTELPAFYQMATLFVYPSRFEGFGIPIIEAQRSGIPVIAATGSCLEEAGGTAALYTHPDDAEELRDLITSVLSQPTLQTTMREGGLRHSQRFNTPRLMEDLMSVYKQLLLS